MRIAPCDKYRSTLAKLQGRGGGGGSSSSQAASSGSTPAASKKSIPKRSASEASTPSRTATPQQIQCCQKILKSKSLYDVLNVSKGATEDEMKRQYKKQALRLHPDKNPSPQASEAFKRLNNAMAVLSDSEKRRMYDMTGDESGGSQTSSSSGFGGGFGGGSGFGSGFGGGGGQRYSHTSTFGGAAFAEDFMTPEDLLFHLFSGGRSRRTPRAPPRSQSAPHTARGRGPSARSNGSTTSASPPSPLTQCLHLLPFLFLILMSLLSTFPFSGTSTSTFSETADPFAWGRVESDPFSFSRSYYHTVERVTLLPGQPQVTFFLTPARARSMHHPKEVTDLEREVLHMYGLGLQKACLYEQQSSRMLFSFSARNTPQPSCVKLDAFRKAEASA